jgi:CheY-like chemotaxis protein
LHYLAFQLLFCQIKFSIMENRKKILLIDDSSVNNLLLQNILEDEGFEVQIAFSGREGLEKIDINKPDLVVLDIMMPRMDGFEVLKQIISNPETKNIPVSMLTAKKDSKDEELAREIGAVDYMTKPVDIENTLQRIRKFLDY